MLPRKCIVINARSAIALVMIFVLSGIRQSQTQAEQFANNTIDKESNNFPPTAATTAAAASLQTTSASKVMNDTSYCPGSAEMECSQLLFPCIRCTYNHSCHYGQDLNVTCNVVDDMLPCEGVRSFVRQMNCRYCYQTDWSQQTCILRGNCNSANLKKHYSTNCTVHPNVLCMGNRVFKRNVKCNWTQGYRWSTALLISVTLGGFGADRFYLGHWQEGIGKLFSFGGLGVWTIIDVLLISLHYLGPADGSLYI